MSRQLIATLGEISTRRPLVSLAIALVLTVAGAWAALVNLRVELDVAALLPRDSKVLREDRRAFWDFGTHDFILCALEVRPGAFADSRAAEEFLVSIQERVELALDDQRFFRRRADFLERREVLFTQDPAAAVAVLTNEDLNELEQLLRPGALSAAVEAVAQAAAQPGADLAALQREALGLRAVLRRSAIVEGGPLRKADRGGYYLSNDGEMMLIVLWPQAKSSDLLFARSMKLFLEETRAALYKRNPAWRDKLEIHFVGPHVENAQGAADVRRDIGLTMLVSFVTVLLLFFAAFRQPESLLLIGLPILAGVAWTMGFTSLLVDRITQVTLTFAAILIGLGVDFSIHLYNRYLEYFRLGVPALEAMRQAMVRTGPTILAGAVTSGFAFFGMALTRFEGFRELGLFGGIGIVMSLLAMTLILPPLIVLLARASHGGRGPLATLGLKKVTYMVTAYPRMTVAAGLCIVTYLGLHAREAGFNPDFQSLRQPPERYTATVDKVRRHFELPRNQVMVIVENEDLEAALQENDRVYANLSLFSARLGLTGIDSLRAILPSAASQAASLSRFLGFPFDRFRSQLAEEVERHPQLPADFFEPLLARLEEARVAAARELASGGNPVSLSRVNDPIFIGSVQRQLTRDEATGVYRVITRVYAADSAWTEDWPERFADLVAAGLDKPPIILGSAVLGRELRGVIITDLARIVLVVFICVALYLYWYFRSPGRAALAMVPVVFALLSMLGAVRLLGIQLDYLNIIALPMIVGIGVDSGIHLIDRLYEEPESHMRPAIERTGRAIVITGMTTIFGFGSLSVASFPGIREIGILSIVGIGCTLFAALVFLPALIRMLDPRYTYAGGAGDEIG